MQVYVVPTVLLWRWKVHCHGEPVSCRHLKTLLDIGDIVGVTGPLKRTDKGELSIVAQELQVRGFRLPLQ